MSYTEECPHCGNKIRAYIHALNQPMVSALRQLVDYWDEYGKSCNLQRDLRLTKNQYNNFQKLAYFGLVGRTTNGWYPSELGREFIYGRARSWNKVATFKGQTVGFDHPVWKGAKVRPSLKHIREIDEIAYKNPIEYIL